MRQLIIILAGLAFVVNAMVGNDGEQQAGRYCAKVKDGITTVIYEGAALTEEVVLRDSTILKPDGTLLKRNGKRLMLKDGECISKDGATVR